MTKPQKTPECCLIWILKKILWYFNKIDPFDTHVWGGCANVWVLPAGHNEGTIAVAEGELLYVIEEDKGDGWTRVRRNEDEEGYVPTSYVEVFLETNAKGAMTYI